MPNYIIKAENQQLCNNTKEKIFPDINQIHLNENWLSKLHKYTNIEVRRVVKGDRIMLW